MVIGIFTIPASAGRTTQPSTTNPGGFWSALRATSWHRWSRNHQRGGDALWTTFSQSRTHQRCEYWRQPCCCDHEIVLFRILRGGSEVKRRIQPWTSGEQNLSSSGIYLEESQGAQPWREEVSRSFSWFSRITSSKLTNGLSRQAENQAKAARNLQAWTKSSWLNSDIKRKRTRYGSRKVTSEEYRETIWMSRDGVRKAKSRLASDKGLEGRQEGCLHIHQQQLEDKGKQVHCWMELGSCYKGHGKDQGTLMPSLPQSSLLTLTFRNPRFLRPVESLEQGRLEGESG